MAVMIAIDYQCTVFNVNYRLAPEHKCPTGAMDFYKAIKWVIANANQWNIDTSKVVVGGVSAGGMMSAAAAYHLALNDEAHLIKALFLWCPQLSDEINDIPKNQLNDFELKFLCADKVASHDLLVDDPSKERNNPYLFPGRMPEE